MTAAVPGRHVVSDAELVQAAAAGDRAAFAAIYDRYADPLHDFCIGMLRNREAAADCVHDAFCIAANSLSKLREPAKLRPWLYSIARYEALRCLRGRKREQAVEELPEESDTGPGPATLTRRNELAELIAAAAGGLSERDRAVYELAYRKGLEGADLAEALGVSASNAKKMAQRLRETIERSLGALLVSRAARNNVNACPGLAEILDGWDGKFTVLMRKRISRHIESCPTCDDLRRRMVNPTALLGSAPLLISAPAALRHRTLDSIRLVSSSGPAPTPQHTGAEATVVMRTIASEPTVVMHTIAADRSASGDGEGRRSRFTRRAVAGAGLIAGLIAVPAVAIAVQHNHETSVNPANVIQSSVSPSTIARRVTPTTALPAVSIAAPPTESSPPPARVVEHDPTITYEAPATVTAPPQPTGAAASPSVGPTTRTSKVFTPPPVNTQTPQEILTLTPTAPSEAIQPNPPSGGSTSAPSPGGRNIRTPPTSLEPLQPDFGDSGDGPVG
jgi:RNA polymerase sigma factor (sigma-70 family)